MNKKNIKIIIFLVIIAIIVLAIIFINKNKEKNIEEQTNTITQEQATNTIIGKVKEDLKEAGLVLENEREVKLNFRSESKGYSYDVHIKDSENTENNTIEIYFLDMQDKIDLFGSVSVANGEVDMKRGNNEGKALLYGNILILNCQDKNIKSILVKTLS